METKKYFTIIGTPELLKMIISQKRKVKVFVNFLNRQQRRLIKAKYLKKLVESEPQIGSDSSREDTYFGKPLLGVFEVIIIMDFVKITFPVIWIEPSKAKTTYDRVKLFMPLGWIETEYLINKYLGVIMTWYKNSHRKRGSVRSRIDGKYIHEKEVLLVRKFLMIPDECLTEVEPKTPLHEAQMRLFERHTNLIATMLKHFIEYELKHGKPKVITCCSFVNILTAYYKLKDSLD